jgi:guanylate kinase
MLLDIDIQGARRLKRLYRDSAVAIMIFPPGWDELRQRLQTRRTDDEASIARRLSRAREEVDAFSEYDYWVLNHERDSSIALARAIVAAERARVSRIVVAGSP